MNDIESEILELISRKTEGAYWDFKQQWYSHNADFVHDIICMANSPANRDCYIIIGVKDETYEIVGVESQNRKNQQNVIDLLNHGLRWAGGYVPEVYVKTILFRGKELDIIVIKQSNNTPFYLLEDYKSQGKPIFKGAIYTRKGDTNTPKTETADIYDTEILWKRRFGLLYNPSQRAKFYLKDIDGWEMVDGEVDKSGVSQFFYYYKIDPDYKVYILDESDEEEKEIDNMPKDINDSKVGSPCYYLYSFCNVSYHTDFANDEKVVLYYRDVPLFSSMLECIDESRTLVVPPRFWIEPYYIEDSFCYLMFQFVFAHLSKNYSQEAKMMLMRVIPVYKHEKECEEFKAYIENRGFSPISISTHKEKLEDEALERFKKTRIVRYESYGNPQVTELIAQELQENPDLVINFAHPDNGDFEEITRKLQIGKMLVDWLKDWRNCKGEDILS